MKAVLLAAGHGRRLAPLTDTTPKPLIEVGGKKLIERLFETLPDEITEVIVVTKYLEEKIKDFLGNEYKGKKITFVTQGDFAGTYGALLSAKSLLIDGSFIVMGCDDIFQKDELALLTREKLAFGVHKKFLPGKEWLVVVGDGDGYVRALRKATDEEFRYEQYMATGVYVLNESLWKLEPYVLPNGEYGLPQTLRPLFIEEDIKMIEQKHWLQVNTHEELSYAEMIVKDYE